MSPVGGLTRCAVPGCPNKRDGYANLCGLHKQPGLAIEIEGNNFVITFWLVRHGKETGIVLLNDYALGDLHGGAEGFRAQLQAQGFTGIRLLGTLEELDAAGQQVLAAWSGPWLCEYPWERPGTPADRWQPDPWQNVSRFVAKRFQLIAARKRS